MKNNKKRYQKYNIGEDYPDSDDLEYEEHVLMTKRKTTRHNKVKDKSLSEDTNKKKKNEKSL